MHWITRTAATAATTLALALPAVGIAQAGSVPAHTSSTTALAAATCHYIVTGDGVAVRPAPDRNTNAIKQKYRGDHVTGPCRSVFNDGRWWTEVYLGSGGTAWMASAYLAQR